MNRLAHPYARRTRGLRAALLAAALAFPAVGLADGIAGHWRINEAVTRELQPAGRNTGPTSSGLGQPVVIVGGMPVPLPGTSAPQPGLGGPSPDPMVLRAGALTVTPAGDELLLEFHGVGSERLRRGNDQGLKSRWNARKLTTRYSTTTRTVSQTWTVDRDGRLVVTVKLDPDHGKSQTHKRVFDRVEDNPATPPS